MDCVYRSEHVVIGSALPFEKKKLQVAMSTESGTEAEGKGSAFGGQFGVNASFGVFGAHFGVNLGTFWGRFGSPSGRSEANLDTCTPKRGGGAFSVSPFGHEKWARELAKSRLENPKVDLNRPEKGTRWLCEEESVKTFKNSDLVNRNAWFWWP